MKQQLNIPVLIIAFVMLFATNGIVVFEHICNSSHSRDLSILKSNACEMEKPVASCCAKKVVTKKDCCEHKFYFKKLTAEFTTQEIAEIQHHDLFDVLCFTYTTHTSLHQEVLENFYSGLSPPGNYFIIQSLLQPTRQKLQIYLC